MRKLSTSEMRRPSVDEALQLARHPIRVVVENVRSAYNVGAILRTADALLVEHVHLAGFTPSGHHRGVNKSALGAQDSVPWSDEGDVGPLLERLKAEGHTLVAVEITDQPRDSSALTQAHFPVALVVGNEVSGITPETLAQCDLALELPQYGAKHSLNVSVALGVVAYDVVRRWEEIGNP